MLLNLPSQSNVNTTFHLRADGDILPESQTRVVSPSNTTSQTLSSIVDSTGTTTVSLTATSALNLTGSATTDVLATITFLKLN
ncbi:MAG: hypothetical protein MSL26_09145 [Clostridiales bacterium]|nr:hypothetical protein [Clostridiales bacterium]